MLSEGDSKAYGAVCDANVYGDRINIEKEDCINHVAKRMGTELRKLANASKMQKTAITGKGKLSNLKMKRFQNYYGKAIKTYSSNCKISCKNVYWEFRYIFHQQINTLNMSIVHLGNHHGVFGKEQLPSQRSLGVIKDMTLSQLI